MARSLAQTLTRLTPINPSSTVRFFNFRQRSGTAERFAGKELDESEVDMEKVAMKNLEDAIHRIVVKRSEPGWLPFAPGASYWVPPKSKSRGFAEVIGKLAENPTPVKVVKTEQALSRAHSRGWPSSAYYFKGVSHSPLEGETAPKHTLQSEEEEG